MKVLFINETFGRGSHGKICSSLMDILHADGHEALAAYGRESVPNEYEPYAIRVGSKWGIYAHVIGSRLFDNSGFYSRRATEKLIKYIDKLDPDIIHLHNIHGYYIHIGVLFKYLAASDRKVIWTLHDCWPFTGHCTCSDYIGCRKWLTGCNHCPQLKDYPAALLFDRSKKNYIEKRHLFTSVAQMHLVVPSEWLKRETEQSFLGLYPIRIIRSGIDLSIFRPKETNFRKKYHLEGKQILLSVANAWSRRKGIELLNDLARNLSAERKLVLVGNLRECSVDKHILTIDHTANQEELAEIYSAADIYLNLSYEETQGLTTTEALACGTPVVASRHTAIPEGIDASCGVVVDEETIESIMLAIRKAENINSDDCIRFAQKYDKNRCFSEYIELYKEIVCRD